MKKSIYKYFALLSAGAALVGTLCAGTAEAAAPKKEPFDVTCQMLRNDAAKTAIVDHCRVSISFGAVNKNDRAIYTANNLIAAYNSGSKTFWEGNIKKTTIIDGKETTTTVPYYVLRDGRSISCLIKNGESWKAIALPALTALMEKGYGLPELFAANKTAECLNETDKGRTVVFRTDPVPMTELFFSLLSSAQLLPAPEFDAATRQKVRPIEVFVRQDYTNDIISDINADITWFVQDYLKQKPSALTADDEQAALRKILAKSEMNFHISVSDTANKVEFHEIPADLKASFGLEIPDELLSESQLKEKQKAAAANPAEEADEDEE